MWKPRVPAPCEERIAKVVYVSMAADALSGGDVRRLGSEADANNRERAITGLLAYNGRNFLQVIEGPRDPVYGLLARIIRDARHHGLSLVFEAGNAARSFPDWGMRLWGPTLAGAEPLAIPESIEPEVAVLLDRFARLQ
jgi:hypothetical protein